MISAMQRNVKLAKQHAVLFNDHDAGAIALMLAEDAAYTSAHLGDLQGRQSILEAMERFFGAFPDVQWGTDGYLASENEVSFHFAMRATEAATGEAVERYGEGTLTFSDDGLITGVTFEE